MANMGASTSSDFARWLGLVDQDDPTNLPAGCAAVCRNARFSLTGVETRWGLKTAIQGLNQAPVTGLLGCAYTPESASQSYFQAPILFDMDGALQLENPVGSGRTVVIQDSLVTLPSAAHMIGTQTYNRAWMAFSNLLTPSSPMAVYDLFSQTLNPYGMKPVGFGWYAGGHVLVGDVTTPSILVDGVTVEQGNGHTYRATTAGTMGQVQPIWPTDENATVNDNGVIWEEYTPVLANRLPPPVGFQPVHDFGGGTFPANQDVYVIISFVNGVGESLTTPEALSLTTLLVNEAVRVDLPNLSLPTPGWISTLKAPYLPTAINIYEASVPTGNPAPAQSTFQLAGSVSVGTGTFLITHDATSGIFPPTSNTARITGGMLPPPVVAPTVTRDSGGGTFPVGRDVYTLQTYLNATGETTAGPASSVLDTQLNDAVQISVEGLATYEITGINLYEADVPTGADAPPSTLFALVGTFQPGDTATISATAAGPSPPVTNTTGTAGNIAADTLNSFGVYGQRYAVVAYQNSLGTISGIRISAVTGYVVDESGFEIAMFNVPTGPSNIVARVIGFTVANGTNAGPFYSIPTDTVSNGIPMTSTIINDNTSSSGIFNFTDTFLIGSLGVNNITDRLQVIEPNPCIDIYFSPSTSRLFQTGVPGTYSGHWASLALDVESYYGADKSKIAIGNDDGERAICVREYRNSLFSFRERSAFSLSASTGDPATWSASQIWSKVGPCGPRAIDVCGEFIVFVHSSGIYRYEADYPELVTKEIPRFWSTINWKAQQTIWCAIDVEQHEIHFGFPVNGSPIPNQKLTLNYEEGWNNPLLWGRVSGKEATIEQARKYSVDDVAGFVGLRIYRTVPDVPDPMEGPLGISQATVRNTISQMMFTSSGPDGTVQAVQPGIYNDNGDGIDFQYETTSVGAMQALSHLQGANFNVRGYGLLYASFIPGARMVTDWRPGDKPFEVKLRPLELELVPTKGITRMAPSRTNEKWRLRLTNGKVADNWCAIKEAIVFTSPMFSGREVNE